MLTSLALIVLGLGLLVAGGEILLRGAVGLAVLLRLTPAIIGLTVVAAGTSVPELAVSGVAAYEGSTDIAVANVVGSNIFNASFILGICAIVRPYAVTGNTLRLEYPVLVLVTLLCLVIAQDGQINRLDALFCLIVYGCFTAYMVSLVREQVSVEEAKELKAEVKELMPPTQKPRTWVCVALLVTGIALLGAGAQSTVTGAVGIARLLGWSERLIGLTLVSAGTGLPEVVASLVSSIRGRSDVAVGNVIGSNLFNILMILGVTGLIYPLPVPDQIITSDCWWMIGVTLLLLPILALRRRVSRWDGVLLLVAYFAYLGVLISNGG